VVAVCSVAMERNVTLIRGMAKPRTTGRPVGRPREIPGAKEITYDAVVMDIKIAAMLACDWKHQDIADHFGLHINAIRHRFDRYPHSDVIPQVRTWVRTALDRYIEDRLRAAEEDMREMKKELHKKSYKLVAKAVDHGLSQDESKMPDPVHLRAAEMGIERTEGKPLDRKAIMTRNENVTRKEVDGGELDEILREMAQINQLRRPAGLIEGVRDAEIVQE